MGAGMRIQPPPTNISIPCANQPLRPRAIICVAQTGDSLMPVTTITSWTDQADQNRISVEHYPDSPTVYIRHEQKAEGGFTTVTQVELASHLPFRVDNDSPTEFRVMTIGYREDRPYGNPRKKVRRRVLIELETDSSSPTATIRSQESRPTRADSNDTWKAGVWEDVETTHVTPNGIQA